MALNWEIIDWQRHPDDEAELLVSSIRTERAGVPGGWLVRSVALRRELTHPRGGQADVESSIGLALAFVPDADHGWNQ